LGLVFDHSERTWALGVMVTDLATLNLAESSLTSSYQSSNRVEPEISSERTWFNENLSPPVTGPPAYTAIIPDRSDAGEGTLLEASEAHRLLFALLLSHEAKDVKLYDGDPKHDSTLTADVLQYAEYNGCLPVAAHGLYLPRPDNETHWKDVAHNPAFYLGLSFYLRDETLYEQAMKHCASNVEHFPPHASGDSVETLPSGITPLAWQKHGEVLAMTSTLESKIREILAVATPVGDFFDSPKSEQLKHQGIYLAVTWIAYYLDHGSLNNLPVHDSKYHMGSLFRMRNWFFYSQLLKTIDHALAKDDFGFLGARKPSRKSGSPTRDSVKSSMRMGTKSENSAFEN
jgi:hypothetical protein